MGRNEKTIGQKIYECIKEHAKCKPLRIGFCPYNESMWDSMQTVYEAAEADEEAKAYIIPIPYYSLDRYRNPVKLNFHFEDYQCNFPKMLTQCDVLVIHNAYDQNNYVTRTMVYSDFLKHVCRKLVYIPYYLPGDAVSRELVMQYGVFNADMIFVSSESIRQCYINYLSEIPHVERKIFALGSPKLDVLEKNYIIPEEWNTKIKDKHVILYNTSIYTFLHDPKKLDKIQKHINEWRNEKDLCVIWRPHPLLEDTIRAFKPELLDRYNKLLYEFISLPNSILDKTSNAAVAMKISDECISDSGSIINMYTKKLTRE